MRREALDHHTHDEPKRAQTRATPTRVGRSVEPARLEVSHPHDADEREAEAAAQRVLGGQPAWDAGQPGVTGPKVARAATATGASLFPSAGAGSPLPAAVRGPMEDAFGHDFSGVRLHDNRASDALNRELAATAFTVGSDIYFRRGHSSTLTHDSAHLLAHELAHVAQQDGEAAVPSRIHRHASWEHKMLGDISPDELEVIASGRDVVKSGTGKGTQRRLQLPGGKSITGDDVLHTIDQEIERLQYFAKNPPTEATTTAADQLVTDFADHQGLVAGPLAKRLAAAWTVRLVSIPLKDGTKAVLTYGEVNTLPDFFGNVDEIKQTDPQMFRNYLDGIREESIRKFMRLRNEISGGLKKSTGLKGRMERTTDKYDPDDPAHKVGQSMGNTGTSAPNLIGLAGGDAYGELKMMGAVGEKAVLRKLAPTSARSEKKAQLAGKEETSYTAGLGRNACHFAPYSWHAWGDAHRKAEVKARDAYDLRDDVELDKLLDQVGNTTPTQAERKARQDKLTRADDLQNEALVENAFADHFLQDSFAAGHLINKTLIMQWFTKWLDQNATKRDYTTEAKWRQVQNIAYGQAGVAGMGLYTSKVGTTASNDPQTVENLEKVGSGVAERGATWEDRYAALGLTLPRALSDKASDEYGVFTWWQLQNANGQLIKASVDELTNGLALDKKMISRDKVRLAVKSLVQQGLVYNTNFSVRDRANALRGDVPTSRRDFSIMESYRPGLHSAAIVAIAADKPGSTTPVPPRPYEQRGKQATHTDFHTFLNHGYLQLSTNVLHDHFCLNGLWVHSERGKLGYKIYGDNSMLQKESAVGVKHSAETSNMSRDSIFQIAANGKPNAGYKLDDIAKRLPRAVSTVQGNHTVPLEDWHQDNGGLHTLCFETIFPEAAALFSKSTAVASDKLAEKISRDVHTGEAF